MFNPKRSNSVIFYNSRTPPPPRGALWPLLVQPQAGSSGPPRVTLISSGHKTVEESVFRLFFAQSWHFNLISLVQWWSGFSLPRPWAPCISEHSGRFGFWNTAALEDNGFRVAWRLILLKVLAVNLHLFLPTRLSRHFWLFATFVLWSRPNIFAIWVLNKECCFPLKDFSQCLTCQESVRSLFICFCPLLPEEKKLPNNHAHLDIYGVDLFRPHLPSLHKCTSPGMLESNLHSSLWIQMMIWSKYSLA